MLSIELYTGECFFDSTKPCRSEHVAKYFTDLAKELQSKNYAKAHIFLDKNTTHLQKMQDLFYAHIEEQGIKLGVKFHYFAPYSPKLNIVEYLIRIIRQKWLHHASYKQRLKEVEERLKEKIENEPFITQEQIINILQHIQDLVLEKNSVLSP